MTSSSFLMAASRWAAVPSGARASWASAPASATASSPRDWATVYQLHAPKPTPRRTRSATPATRTQRHAPASPGSVQLSSAIRLAGGYRGGGLRAQRGRGARRALHPDLALHRGALGSREAAALERARQGPGGENLHAGGGREIAADDAADHDGRGVDVGVHLGAFADVDRAGQHDLPFELAQHLKIPLPAHLALQHEALADEAAGNDRIARAPLGGLRVAAEAEEPEDRGEGGHGGPVNRSGARGDTGARTGDSGASPGTRGARERRSEGTADRSEIRSRARLPRSPPRRPGAPAGETGRNPHVLC